MRATVSLPGDETYVHVGFARSAQAATCADRRQPMQTSASRVGTWPGPPTVLEFQPIGDVGLKGVSQSVRLHRVLRHEQTWRELPPRYGGPKPGPEPDSRQPGRFRSPCLEAIVARSTGACREPADSCAPAQPSRTHAAQQSQEPTRTAYPRQVRQAGLQPRRRRLAGTFNQQGLVSQATWPSALPATASIDGIE